MHDGRHEVRGAPAVGAGGMITITLSTAAELAGATGTTFTLTPVPSDGTAVTAWTCSAGTTPAKYLPANCR